MVTASLSLAAPFFLPVGAPVRVDPGVAGYGTVCRESYPTTLTPRTVYKFFHMYHLATRTSDTAHENKNRSVGTRDVVHA